jgi:PHD/YefM family antitoxin component YafN of YafNO toxin-antitoxin module
MSTASFDQNTTAALRQATKGPVFITENDEPAYILVTIADYEKLVEGRSTLLDAE